METIQTNALTLSYGDKIIINELDLKIPKGEITVLSVEMAAGSRRCCVRLLDC